MGQRKKVKPGDRNFRRGVIGEYWQEWGQGEVLAEALPEGRRQPVATRLPRDGYDGVIVLKPEHLQSPLQLAVPRHDRMLPLFVRDDPECLIGHHLGYKAIVRRTDAYLQDTPGGERVPIDKVPGMNFTTGARYKIRELIEVVEIDEKDPARFGAEHAFREYTDAVPGPPVEQDPSTWPAFEQALDRQHAGFGLVPESLTISAKVHGLRVADRALKAILDRTPHVSQQFYTAENFEAWRQLVFSVISRVLRQIEGDFDDHRDAFLAACDLTEGALLIYSRSWPFPLTDERRIEYERALTDQATSDYGLVSGWRVS